MITDHAHYAYGLYDMLWQPHFREPRPAMGVTLGQPLHWEDLYDV